MRQCGHCPRAQRHISRPAHSRVAPSLASRHRRRPSWHVIPREDDRVRSSEETRRPAAARRSRRPGRRHRVLRRDDQAHPGIRQAVREAWRPVPPRPRLRRRARRGWVHEFRPGPHGERPSTLDTRVSTRRGPASAMPSLSITPKGRRVAGISSRAGREMVRPGCRGWSSVRCSRSRYSRRSSSGRAPGTTRPRASMEGKQAVPFSRRNKWRRSTTRRQAGCRVCIALGS